MGSGFVVCSRRQAGVTQWPREQIGARATPPACYPIRGGVAAAPSLVHPDPWSYVVVSGRANAVR